ncbi:replication factor C large subunit [Methanolinea mesophila]|uniref:replication factor C large subunit n=1 Tax=Methanolinea mesophila TaxID=547055 RepID=UPI001AEAF7D7|nr:replication factor C large subunit [Methanolinea mesophila]MBP1929883.1 replication factor C large subunit [Methanolinea mesophila]
MDWAEKYRPRHLDEVVGNGPSIRQMLEWAQNWTREAKPLILYGKPGTGKTSSAHALAHDMGWEVVELNASDQRTKAVIERVAGSSSNTASLTGAKRKLILLDEADNLQGTADRGGARAIIDVIRDSRQPIILIANDLYGLASELRSRCEPVQFRALQARSIVPRLRYICAAEKIECDPDALRDISEDANGDIRAAINMLYAAAIGREKVDEAAVKTSRKDERSTIFDLVSAVFGRPEGEELMKISYDVNEPPDTIEQWIESNVFSLEDQKSIAEAYRCLSRADEYIGNTYRQQYYTLWRYASALMILGVSASSGGKGIHARIMPPDRWRRMSSSRKQKGIRQEALGKVADGLHMSQASLKEEYFTLLTAMIDQEPLPFAREFSFDADQLNMFIHDKARTQAVVKTLAAEAKEREKEEKEREKEREKKEKAEEKKRIAAEKKKGQIHPEAEPQPDVAEPPAGEIPEEPEKKEKKTQKTLDGFFS